MDRKLVDVVLVWVSVASLAGVSVRPTVAADGLQPPRYDAAVATYFGPGYAADGYGYGGLGYGGYGLVGSGFAGRDRANGGGYWGMQVVPYSYGYSYRYQYIHNYSYTGEALPTATGQAGGYRY